MRLHMLAFSLVKVVCVSCLQKLFTYDEAYTILLLSTMTSKHRLSDSVPARFGYTAK